MRSIIAVFSFFLIIACNDLVDKPKVLLSKEKMSAIIADFAIYEQAYSVRPDINMEAASRYVLVKHKTTASIFRESYHYYLVHPGALEDILDDAKKNIINKDPKLEEYIKKQKKEHPGLPDFVK